MRPEIPPPVITIFLLVGTFSDGLTRNKTDIIIKNIPRITLRISCDSIPTIEAPRKLKRMLGIPNVAIIFLSIPCLKKFFLGCQIDEILLQVLVPFQNLQKIKQGVKI
jgi:hypothetical protein